VTSRRAFISCLPGGPGGAPPAWWSGAWGPYITVTPDMSPTAAISPGLYWLKTTDPDLCLPPFAAGTDVRVLVPEGPRFHRLRERLAAHGAQVRTVGYWLEQELITDIGGDGDVGVLSTRTAEALPTAGRWERAVLRRGLAAATSKEAFETLWEAQDERGSSSADLSVAEVVPARWIPFLPHPTLNPAQAAAVPRLLEGERHLLVVAPTGAGKTTIGMLAALRAVLQEKGKAAWLVPQRTLTDELDRELDSWRRHGLRVERMSGEYSVDVERVRSADLWVTTTEKFEALCRTSALRESLAAVRCLIVDEVHMLGEPERGPVLEAVLARVRDDRSRVRVVGLSATVSNAEQLADWLNADLVRVGWRPSRLTWQLPVVRGSSDRNAAQAARTRMTNVIVDMVTADGGSVLVFCGSKHSVRSTALALANSRGASTSGVRPDDLESVRRVCDAAGIRLHYKDWAYKEDAERAFRERRADVLVATSTVAAGVNLPARAVVVRDTQVGSREVDVATVQQMFGRAGRRGAGESAGWAFMIVDGVELPRWQERLVGGYTVDSQLVSGLPDQVLAEVVRGRIRTLDDAERWWLHTFAYHQGNRSTEPLRRALAFLTQAEYCQVATAEAGDEKIIAATELGALTTRVMVPADAGYELRMALARCAVPAGADDAEETLIALVSRLVPKLASAPIAEHLRSDVAALLRVDGRLPGLDAEGSGHPDVWRDDAALTEYAARRRSRETSQVSYSPGDLSRAALLIVANSPLAFGSSRSDVAGIPLSSLRPVLEDAPRYLHWLGSQGFLGTLHPWAAIVAADLGRRVRWRRSAPPRGSGRLLWMCENMATAVHAASQVPTMWDAARGRGFVSPDWLTRTPPKGNRLDGVAYAKLLRERVGPGELAVGEENLVRPLSGRVMSRWEGRKYRAETVPRGDDNRQSAAAGRGPAGSFADGTALFSWRGDYRATGWLADYSEVAVPAGR